MQTRGNLQTLLYIFLMLGSIALLSACSSTGDATLATARNIFPGLKKPSERALNPEFQYLRVYVGGRSALLVLGEVDPHPLGPIESFYSAEAEVIKIQNGRIVGTAGLSTNWLNVVITPNSQGYERRRDVMPGYRFGFKDRVVVQRLAQAPREVRPRKSGLTQEEINGLAWTEEFSISGATLPRNLIGYARTPNGQEIPTAGFQCMDDGLCMQWERL